MFFIFVIIGIIVVGVVMIPFFEAKSKFQLARFYALEARKNLEELKVIDPKNSNVYDLDIWRIDNIILPSCR